MRLLMKASVDKNNFKITLDNEAIKAIRFCNGFTTDLRIKLTNANRNSLWHWLDQNALGIFYCRLVECIGLLVVRRCKICRSLVQIPVSKDRIVLI